MIPIWRWLRLARRGGGGPFTPPPAPPVADFTGTPLTGEVPLTVVYTNNSTNFTSSVWLSGDGQTATTEDATFTYLVAGTFSPKLTVTGPGGVDSKRRNGYVEAEPDSGGETLFDTGRLGGQIQTIVDFSADAFTCNLMARARNTAKPSGANLYAGAVGDLLQIATIERTDNVAKVVLGSTPTGELALASGLFVYLTWLDNQTLDAERLPITVINPSTFTYPSTGADVAVHTTINAHEIPACIAYQIAFGSDGQPDADHYIHLSSLTRTDLTGTAYTGYFDAGIPTGMVWTGATLTNWTPGGSDSQFTITITDTTGLAVKFTGVPSNFEVPRVIRNDHDQSGDSYLRPDAAQFLSRFGFMRFLDGGRVNFNCYVKSWAGRPRINCGMGVPLEEQIAMCNQLGCNMWPLFQDWVTDDYMTQAATLIRDTLDPSLWCMPEFSNETFNEGVFPQFWWSINRVRVRLKANFHGLSAGGLHENTITSVVKVGGVVTVNMNRPPRFANGATVAFKITEGSTSGYNTADAGNVATVSGNSFTFTNPANSGSGTATCTKATIIGDATDPMYSFDYLTDPRGFCQRMHGEKTYRMGQLFKAVFGELNDRVRIGLMGWERVIYYHEAYSLPWLEDQYGPLSDWCYAIGGAPYPEVSGSTLAQLQTSLSNELDDMEVRAADWLALADSYGVKLWAYEGNIAFPGVNPVLIDSTHTDAIGRAMQKSFLDRLLPYYDHLGIYFTSMQDTGIPGYSNWGIGRTLAADGGAIGAATDMRLQGIDLALLAPPP